MRLLLPAALVAATLGCGCCAKPTPAPAPVPTPTPVPPAPSPAPIAGDGLRVLVVYDDAVSSALPPETLSQLTDTNIRLYLQQHCAKTTDGTPEFRFLTTRTDATKLAANWQAAFKRPRTTLPWLVISNGKTGYEGPLGKTAADTLKLIQQYGGN